MLRDDFLAECNVNRFSQNTINAYWKYILGYIKFYNIKSLSGFNSPQIEAYIKYLASRYSYSTQNTAFIALLFLYRKVLKKKIKIHKDWRTKKPQTKPDILSKEEVTKIIAEFEGQMKLVTQLLYGCGLRKNEALSLRIMDIDFDNKMVMIRQAKGQKDGVLPLPKSLVNPLNVHIEKVENLYKKDIKHKFDGCFLPKSIENKSPESRFEFKWQYLFPANNLVKGTRKRYHIHPSNYDKKLKTIINEFEINKRISGHSFRHSYCTHLIDTGYPLPYVQQLMRHKNISTTLKYVHTTKQIIGNYISPLDTLEQRKDNHLTFIKTA